MAGIRNPGYIPPADPAERRRKRARPKVAKRPKRLDEEWFHALAGESQEGLPGAKPASIDPSPTTEFLAALERFGQRFGDRMTSDEVAQVRPLMLRMLQRHLNGIEPIHPGAVLALMDALETVQSGHEHPLVARAAVLDQGHPEAASHPDHLACEMEIARFRLAMNLWPDLRSWAPAAAPLFARATGGQDWSATIGKSAWAKVVCEVYSEGGRWPRLSERRVRQIAAKHAGAVELVAQDQRAALDNLITMGRIYGSRFYPKGGQGARR